jgi:hypothetical protein
MGRAGIFMELGGLAGRFERSLHLLDLVRRNAGVGFAVEAEHGLLHLRRKIDGTLRRGVVLVDQAAVEGDAGLQVRIVGRIVPHVAAAPAEADDAEPVGVAALRLSPGHGVVEIGEQLGVGLGVGDREQLWQVVDLGQVDAVGFGAALSDEWEVPVTRNAEIDPAMKGGTGVIG